MATRCRYCGTAAGPEPALSDDDACSRCASSDACGRCGHPRTAHVGSFRDGRGCAHVWVEAPATLATGCECAGFAPVGVGSIEQDLLVALGTVHGEASVPVA
jgi:hypothetical protein